MGYTVRDLDIEIAKKVWWLEENNGHEIHKSWLIQAILEDHVDVHGEDSDFALCGAREMVRSRVERHFRTVKADDAGEAEDPQGILPGYEYLQKRYIVPRNGEQVMVRVGAMTREELMAKAEEHRRMGEGHYRHADEIERFCEEQKVA